MDRTLSDTTTPGKSGPGSHGNEGVLRIIGASPFSVTSKTLVAGVEVSYPSAEMQSAYSVTPVYFQLCKPFILTPCSYG